jgi:uridine kinase
MSESTPVKIIGICGGSASGKSTFADNLKREIGFDRCVILKLDNYYIDFVRAGRNPAVINYDHPDSFDLDLFAASLKKLSAGQDVQTPVYDFKTHTRSARVVPLYPAEFILAEGLFLFNINVLEGIFHLKIFIDTPENVRLERRINRDRKERGRPESSILLQYEKFVKPMYTEYVVENKKIADIIVQGDKPFDSKVLSIIHSL